MPVPYMSETHGGCVHHMLYLSHRLCQWISCVTVCPDLANLHFTSINDLSDKVISSQHVLGPLVSSRFLSLCNRSIVVTIELDVR